MRGLRDEEHSLAIKNGLSSGGFLRYSESPEILVPQQASKTRKASHDQTIYADSIYVCNGLVTWLYCRWLRFLEIVKRPARSPKFVVLAKRWIVERTFAWVSRCRRLSKDYERLPAVSETWIHVSMIHRMLRHLRPL
jgi:transposase